MSDFVVSIHPNVKIIFSTIHDGSMSSGGGTPSLPEHTQNVENFLHRHDFPIHGTRLYVTYGEENTYTDVVRVGNDNSGNDVVADALFTTEIREVITLPVADCVATIVYDPTTSMLGVLHLGRHSSVAGLIESFVIDVADTLGSDPRDWYVWMSPSIRKKHDRLDYFQPQNIENWREFMYEKNGKIHIDTVGHNRSRFIRAGVSTEQITISPYDTYDNPKLFSHRAATETNNDARQGRMLLAAMICSE